MLVAMHDLSLAARFLDRIALLAGGRVRAIGHWRTVLSNANIQAAYGVEALVGSIDGLPYVLPVAAA